MLSRMSCLARFPAACKATWLGLDCASEGSEGTHFDVRVLSRVQLGIISIAPPYRAAVFVSTTAKRSCSHLVLVDMESSISHALEYSWLKSLTNNPLLWLLLGLVAIHGARLCFNKAAFAFDRLRGYVSHHEHERMKAIEGVECQLMRMVNSMATLEGRMNDMADDMREVRNLVQEHVDAPVNIMEHLIDIHADLKANVGKWHRLTRLTKHRLDNQNFILQCLFYSMDEPFLLLCDMSNILEEAIDPTSPYPFTLRLANRPRGRGARPLDRAYY